MKVVGLSALRPYSPEDTPGAHNAAGYVNEKFQ
jgi:hypothetical protein